MESFNTDTLPDVIERMRPSVVQFARQDNVTRESIPFGSGFIVDANGDVVTAAHVILAAQRAVADGHRVTIGLAYPNLDNVQMGGATLTLQNSFHHVGLSEPRIDDRNDVAAVRMDPNPFTHPLTPLIMFDDTPGPQPLFEACSTSTDRLRDGEAIAVSGYPLNSPTLITTAGNLAAGWHTQIVPTPAGSTEPSDIIQRYLADISVNPGNSGGPTYRLADGAVIGVCIAYRIAPVLFIDADGGQVAVQNRPIGVNAGLAQITPIQHALDLLR